VEEPPLVPPGNPLRPRSLWYLLPALLGLVVLMASDAHWALSVPVGVILACVAAAGALDFGGCFDDPAEPELGRLMLPLLRRRSVELLVAVVAWVLALRAAVAGSLPAHAWLAPALVTLTSLGGVLAAARFMSQLTPASAARPLRERLGLWLVCLGVLLYVPWLGSYSLLDPWETHYGEVAREMLARNDWISFWWGHEGWFWSKPALDFWIQGLFFSLLGVGYRPDQMLAAAAHGSLPQPEWAARMPVVLLSLLAVYLLYRFVSKAAGARAGLLSGVALLCTPYWALLSHQSMTDMPYVAPLTAAVSAFGLGLLTDPETRAPALELCVRGRRLSLSGFHVLFGAVLVSVLPQLCYLISRNVTLQIALPPYGFRWHLDELFSGSGLRNCGMPGNEACRSVQPVNALFQPLLGALIFGAALGYLVHLNRGERRLKRLWYLAAWYFTALSALAKGAPGLVLPLAIAGAVLLARREWQELTRVEIAGFCLLFAAVCLPWYVQAYMRHGEPFTDRLLTHDMYKRAFVHVHDTNSGSDVSFGYYVWQLGYGLFPWTGLALIGLGLGLKRAEDDDAPQRELARITLLWLAVAFGLFTLSLTKFHHYALPCTPPLAIAAGLALDRALGPTTLRGGLGRALVSRSSDPALGVLGLAAALLTLLVARDLFTTVGGDVPASARLLHLFSYNYNNAKRPWPAELNFESVACAFGAVAAASAALLATRFRAHAALFTAVIGACFTAFALWIYLPRLAPHFGQRELFLAYYAERRGPNEPIVAYQMNWKGENFYTSNHIPTFVQSGAKFTRWLKRLKAAGTKVVFFVTEHGRLGALKSELGSGARVATLTDKRLNNKFALVRVELAGADLDDETRAP
jgi:4-amino-4-deoxy-L-arabinose transferase-like glycosyltransferase